MWFVQSCAFFRPVVFVLRFKMYVTQFVHYVFVLVIYIYRAMLYVMQLVRYVFVLMIYICQACASSPRW